MKHGVCDLYFFSTLLLSILTTSLNTQSVDNTILAFMSCLCSTDLTPLWRPLLWNSGQTVIVLTTQLNIML